LRHAALKANAMLTGNDVHRSARLEYIGVIAYVMVHCHAIVTSVKRV
jgi:hypothetical protein